MMIQSMNTIKAQVNIMDIMKKDSIIMLGSLKKLVKKKVMSIDTKLQLSMKMLKTKPRKN